MSGDEGQKSGGNQALFVMETCSRGSWSLLLFFISLTGTGKTYTMLGTDREPGIYIRALDDLFKALEGTTEEMDYRVSMSYLEVKCPCCLGFSKPLGAGVMGSGMSKSLHHTTLPLGCAI